jgi:plastocyanin
VSQRLLAWAAVTAAALLAMPGAVAGAKGGPSVRQVQALDACDPTTFNAAAGPGTCTRNGGLSFAHFIGQLQKHGRAAAWRFSPEQLKVSSGGSLQVTNRGGEAHTFTPVANFGGGCVPPLNAVLGLTPVPECSDQGLFNSTFIAQGATLDVTGLQPGVHLYECLIHPWMHATVTVR